MISLAIARMLNLIASLASVLLSLSAAHLFQAREGWFSMFLDHRFQHSPKCEWALYRHWEVVVVDCSEDRKAYFLSFVWWLVLGRK
jgi:hypothetical protein